MDRREFVWRAAGAGAALGGLSTRAWGAAAEPAYPFATLADALAPSGFRPDAADSFSVVWAADIHYGAGNPARILPPLLAELNAMRPRPAFFGIVGDLIVKASTCFGQVPGDQQKQEAIEEFKLFKRGLEGLDPQIPVKMTLGNHDTYPGEGRPELFHSVFPDQPVDHSCTVKGVPFIFLNGGSSGAIDTTQRKWFSEEVRKLHTPGGTLVTIVHQPSLGSVTKERGIPAAVREALADAQGDFWLIGGHEHHNLDECFRLPRAVITQATITAGNPETWGEELPGYWVYCFTGGRLVARVFRRIGHGFALASAPPKEKAVTLRLPFEGHSDILWKVMVGEGDKPYLVEADAAWCLNYWHYNRHLVYQFPLDLAGGKARRFSIVEIADGNEPRKYLVSPDGKNWSELGTVDRDGCYTSFPIPQNCLDAGQLAVRIEHCVVSGFALTG